MILQKSGSQALNIITLIHWTKLTAARRDGKTRLHAPECLDSSLVFVIAVRTRPFRGFINDHLMNSTLERKAILFCDVAHLFEDGWSTEMPILFFALGMQGGRKLYPRRCEIAVYLARVLLLPLFVFNTPFLVSMSNHERIFSHDSVPPRWVRFWITFNTI